MLLNMMGKLPSLKQCYLASWQLLHGILAIMLPSIINNATSHPGQNPQKHHGECHLAFMFFCILEMLPSIMFKMLPSIMVLMLPSIMDLAACRQSMTMSIAKMLFSLQKCDLAPHKCCSAAQVCYLNLPLLTFILCFKLFVFLQIDQSIVFLRYNLRVRK